jgi:hypothetical protein
MNKQLNTTSMKQLNVPVIISLYIFFFLWRYSPDLALGLPPWNSPFHFGLLDLRHSVGLLGRVISSSQGLPVHKHRKTHTYTHKHQTSMPWVGLEPTIPASERAKTVHVLDRSATVTGQFIYYILKMLSQCHLPLEVIDRVSSCSECIAACDETVQTWQ